MRTNPTQYPVLIAEDNNEDFFSLKRAFKKLKISNPLYRCLDGDDTLDFLYQRGKYSPETAPRPALILLDLNMPGVSGHEILQIIKSLAVFKDIPVIILTSSAREKDIAESYRDGANSYLVKPVNFENFLDAIELLKDYWLSLVVLPQHGSNE